MTAFATFLVIVAAALFLIIAGAVCFAWGEALARRAYRDMPPPSRRRGR